MTRNRKFMQDLGFVVCPRNKGTNLNKEIEANQSIWSKPVFVIPVSVVASSALCFIYFRFTIWGTHDDTLSKNCKSDLSFLTRFRFRRVSPKWCPPLFREEKKREGWNRSGSTIYSTTPTFSQNSCNINTMNIRLFLKFSLFLIACAPKLKKQSMIQQDSSQVKLQEADQVIADNEVLAFDLKDDSQYAFKDQILYLSKDYLDSLGIKYDPKDLQTFQISPTNPSTTNNELQLVQTAKPFTGLSVGPGTVYRVSPESSVAIAKPPLGFISRTLRQFIIPASDIRDRIQTGIFSDWGGFQVYVRKVIKPLENKYKTHSLQSFTVFPSSASDEVTFRNTESLSVTSNNFEKKTGNVLVVMLGNNDSYLRSDYSELMGLLQLNPNIAQSKIVIMNYRKDVNKLSEIVDDAKQLIKNAITDVGGDTSRVTVYGHSLGGAIATTAVSDLATDTKSVKLIADRTFASLDGFAPKWIPFIPKLILGDEWNLNVLEKWKKIPTSNKIAIHDTADEVIPSHNSLGAALQSEQNNKDHIISVEAPPPLPGETTQIHNAPLKELTVKTEASRWPGKTVGRLGGQIQLHPILKNFIRAR